MVAQPGIPGLAFATLTLTLTLTPTRILTLTLIITLTLTLILTLTLTLTIGMPGQPFAGYPGMVPGQQMIPAGMVRALRFHSPNPDFGDTIHFSAMKRQILRELARPYLLDLILKFHVVSLL